MTGCTFESNSALLGGALYASGPGRYWVRQTTFTRNVAFTAGGALFATNCSVTLTNQTRFDANVAESGRSIYVNAEAPGVVVYALPAPSGHWISDAVRCSQTAQNLGCRDPQHSSLTIKLLMRSFDDELPYKCSPGHIASSADDTATQASSSCAGTCAGGQICAAGEILPRPCPAGHYCPPGTPTPLPCMRGTYNPDEGWATSEGCRPCRAGFYCGVAGDSVPQPCPTSTFSSIIGAMNSSVCTDCPDENAHTDGPNSTRVAECRCARTFYADYATLDPPGFQWSCKPCFFGTNTCPNSGTTLRTLALMPGFYRISVNSTDVRRCSDAATGCPNGRAGCKSSTSGCRSEGGEPCRTSLTGPFCRLCSSWADNVTSIQEYYVAATNEDPAHCAACSTSNWLLFSLVTAMGLILVIASRAMSARLPGRNGCRVARFMPSWFSGEVVEKYTLQTKIKVLVSFYQVISRLEDAYELSLPPVVSQLLIRIRLTVSMGLEGLSFSCVISPGYKPRLLFWMSVPLALAACVLCSEMAQVCTSRDARGQLVARTVPMLLRLAFFFYPIVTNIAFEAFSCVSFDDNGSYWLIADVAVRCDSQEHVQVKAIAWVAVFFYSIGLWAITGALLLSIRRAIQTGQPTTLMLATRFIHQEYKAQLYGWELAEMARRFLLVGFFTVEPYAPGTMMQLILATILSIAYLIVQLVGAPWRAFSDNFLAMACSTCLAFFFLGALIFKYVALTSTSNASLWIGKEQVADFLLDQGLLVALLCVCVVGALVACALILIAQFFAEMKRRRREALSALQRRLRYRKNEGEVPAPSLQHCDFHVFLSHVWGTAQDQMRIVKLRLREMIPEIRVFLDVDDLKEGKGAEYVDASLVTLVFVSSGYFMSQNCMRELLRAVARDKHMVTLLEPEGKHGAMERKDVRAELVDADARYGKRWGDANLRDEVVCWLDEHLLRRGQHVCELIKRGGSVAGIMEAALFDEKEPIEWNRIGAFQDVTMRLVAESLLPEGHGGTFVQGELVRSKVKLRSPRAGCQFHVYCSSANPGAIELIDELQLQCRSMDPSKPDFVIRSTTVFANLQHCECFLVYLTGRTWTRGEGSEAFATEVTRAMADKVKLLLVHEMPGVGGQDKRFGVGFETFFACPDGTTPLKLISNGIYSDIAIPLKGGEWRVASMVMLMQALAADAIGIVIGHTALRRSSSFELMSRRHGAMRRSSSFELMWRRGQMKSPSNWSLPSPLSPKSGERSRASLLIGNALAEPVSLFTAPTAPADQDLPRSTSFTALSRRLQWISSPPSTPSPTSSRDPRIVLDIEVTESSPQEDEEETLERSETAMLSMLRSKKLETKIGEEALNALKTSIEVLPSKVCVFKAPGPVGVQLADLGGALVVYNVIQGSQAAGKGVQAGSVLREVNGTSAVGWDAATAKLFVMNARRPLQLRFALNEYEMDTARRDAPFAPSLVYVFEDKEPIGIVLGNLGNHVVVYHVEEGSAAHQKGVPVGSLLREVNGASATNWDAGAAATFVAGTARPLRIRLSPSTIFQGNCSRKAPSGDLRHFLHAF